MKRLALWIAGLAFALASPAYAQTAKKKEDMPKMPEASVKVHKIDDKGMGEEIGKVYFKDGPKGLIVSPRLKNLPPGPHGFHVHENRNCGPKAGPDGKMVPGLAAGGHYDRDKTGKHEGPDGKGHIGDLPVLTVAADGTAKGSMTASRLKVADLKGRSLVIHAGGDNYSDQPAPLGGGGARIACGLF
jgi:Cu-Zn family superoxide dismutase